MADLTNPALEQGSNADAEALDSLFNKYKERDEKKGKKFLSKEEMLARFFNPRKDTEIFRALPKREGEELIEEGYFHKIQAGKYPSNSTAVYCPAKNNPKVQAKDKDDNLVFEEASGKPVMVDQYCPICAKSKAIKSKQDRSLIGKKLNDLTDPKDKEIFNRNKELFTKSTKFEAKLYYIIRGIDRGAEKDGVKFWRFKQNFKSQGVHDKLWKPIIADFYKQTGKHYNDVEKGVDLLISVVDNEFNGRTFRDVSAINTKRQISPLHTDEMIAKQWLSDKTTWREVFKPKKAPGITEEQYLQLAAEERDADQKNDMRNTPYYDEDLKKWQFPNHPDLEEAANTKNRNLDADAADQYDVPEEGYVSAVSNVISQKNDIVDITAMSTAVPTNQVPKSNAIDMSAKVDAPATTTTASSGAYDDLPF
jgi:hypothetical protein